MAASDFQQLQSLFESLSKDGQAALLDYAEFLSHRYPEERQPTLDPVDISRPEKESVVIAIRRLSETYPMLDRQALLHDTASFMMQHVVQGKDADKVIDDLEVYFKQQYEAYIERKADV